MLIYSPTYNPAKLTTYLTHYLFILSSTTSTGTPIDYFVSQNSSTIRCSMLLISMAFDCVWQVSLCCNIAIIAVDLLRWEIGSYGENFGILGYIKHKVSLLYSFAGRQAGPYCSLVVDFQQFSRNSIVKRLQFLEISIP